jgi:hypothetical protein
MFVSRIFGGYMQILKAAFNKKIQFLLIKFSNFVDSSLSFANNLY